VVRVLDQIPVFLEVPQKQGGVVTASNEVVAAQKATTSHQALVAVELVLLLQHFDRVVSLFARLFVHTKHVHLPVYPSARNQSAF